MVPGGGPWAGYPPWSNVSQGGGGFPMLACDPFCRNTLVPLVLRTGLGAIFIFHGFTNITTGEGWGADWGFRLWQKHTDPMPPDVMQELKVTTQGEVRAAWNQERGASMPEELGDIVTQLAVAWGELLCGVALLLGFLT